MKNLALFPVLAAALVFAPFAEAQSNGSNGATYVVTSRLANERQWSKVIATTNADGSVTRVTNAAPGYIERATGLSYRKPGETNWSDAAPGIDIVADGAQSSGARHSVHWLSNINAPGGAVHLVSPGGQDFRSRVYGLAYVDYTTGTNILLSGLQDSIGQIVGTNKVVYPNAFSNGITADVEYVHSQAGLEQNIILRSQLPSPTNFPGLNPRTTRLQVLTEFYSPPEGTKTGVTRGGVAEDTLIRFGTNDMAIGMGHALATEGADGREHRSLGVVSKHWTKMGDSSRDFLIEEIPYRSISNAVQGLPPQASAAPLDSAVKNIASLLPLQPQHFSGVQKSAPMEVAGSAAEKPGVVVDYVMFDADDYEYGGLIFAPYTTYYVSGPLYVFSSTASSTEFESGAVIKFDPLAGSIINEGYYPMALSGPWLVAYATNYNPVVFTSVNDDSSGEQITGVSSGTPSISSATYLVEEGSAYGGYTQVIPHAVFAWAQCAYEDDVDTAHIFADCQFIQCGLSIYVPNDADLYLYNVLFAGDWLGGVDWMAFRIGTIEGADDSALSIYGQQVTADSCWMLQDDGYGIGGEFVNSIFTGCNGSEGTLCSEVSSVDLSTNTGVYELWQNGNVADWTTYYLASGSPYHGAGASGIESDILAQLPSDQQTELQYMTTYSPADGSYPDTGSNPDLGFHYWTNLDSLLDGLPDYWELEYFNTTGINGNSLDSSGANTLIYDYQNSVNPNVVAFTLSVTNFYVSQTNAPMQVTVTSGWPGVYAVLVNNTNLADAVWQSYTSPNITAALGSTNGVYTVLVGLSGSASNPQKAWQSVTFEKDASSLVLMMTNLSSLSGARPFIDPAGYASRALRSISYTVTNAGGGIYSGQGQAVALGINPGDPMHTTNLFSCVDLALTLGTNLVSIQASDWTGATAVTNFAYVFSTNGVTNVPALTLDWPADGTYVAGTNFTVEAGVDDDTAALTLQYTDTNAILQTIAGEVERGGNVWFECVPLPAGTNSYSIIACNAAGNMSTNTFNVIKATSMTLEIEPLDTNQLDSGYVTVAGSVSDTTCAISVNGVTGVNDGEGDWYVENVPLPPGGTVMMEVVATPGSGPPVQCALEQDRPPVVYTQSYSYQLDYTWYYVFDDVTEYSVTEDCRMQWERGVGGTNVEVNLTTNFPGGALADGSSVLQLVWPADNGYLPILGAEAATSNYESGTWTAADSYSNTAPPLVETFEESDSSGAMPGYWDASWTETSSRQVRLFTGGKALRQEQALFDLSETLTNETQVLSNEWGWGAAWIGFFDDYIYDDTVEYAALPFLQPASTPTYVTPQDISLGALGAQASDTNLWTGQPNATGIDITPQIFGSYNQYGPVPNVEHAATLLVPVRPTVGPLIIQQKYPPKILFNSTNIALRNIQAIVGEQIPLTYTLGSGAPAMSQFTWSVPGTAESQFLVSSDSAHTNGYPIPFAPTNTNAISFFWADAGTKTVNCKAKVGGYTLSAPTTFTVVRPTLMMATPTGSVNFGSDLLDTLALQFGTSSTPGISFIITNASIPAAFRSLPYSVAWAQIITSNLITIKTSNSIDGVIVHSNLTTVAALDTTFPYPQNTNTGVAIDSPAVGLNVLNQIGASDTQNSKMWLLYQPTNGNWVPLWTVTWSCTGTAVGSGTNWSFTGPTNISFSTSAYSGAIYPIWTNNVTNTPWIPSPP